MSEFAHALDSGTDEFQAAFDAHAADALTLLERAAPVVPMPQRPRLRSVPVQRTAVE